ncbi:hypothetical protein T07_14110 [Trichinella nelsoni]|uniref:Uncharacterized protein n=1 Tax=Trichinella nelsoni TaxID=6336 RepID=A0A0V0SLJ4_9BILA|nr:hypothetical protein T07_14110 [Trichinella nelsoni]
MEMESECITLVLECTECALYRAMIEYCNMNYGNVHFYGFVFMRTERKPTKQWTVRLALAAGQISYDCLTAILPTFVHERVTNKTNKQRTPVLFHETEHLSMDTNEQRLSTTQTPTKITQHRKEIADHNRSSSHAPRHSPTIFFRSCGNEFNEICDYGDVFLLRYAFPLLTFLLES